MIVKLYNKDYDFSTPLSTLVHLYCGAQVYCWIIYKRKSQNCHKWM